MVGRIASVALISLLGLCVGSGAMAERVQSHPMAEHIQGHPRINEVNQRLATQQHRIAEGVAHGQIDRWRAERDMRRDERIDMRLRRDEAMHDGHVTLGEQVRLNNALDRNSVHIYDQRQ
jgi:hypothetical protein